MNKKDFRTNVPPNLRNLFFYEESRVKTPFLYKQQKNGALALKTFVALTIKLKNEGA